MSAAQAQEIAERTGADLRWLDTAFALAKLHPRQGRGHPGPGRHVGSREGRRAPGRLRAVRPKHRRAHAAFGGPVLMLNGDSHVYLSDNPLSAADPLNYMHPGYDVANFHRIVVHGSTFPLEWLRLTVDPHQNAPASDTSFGPFNWEREIQ